MDSYTTRVIGQFTDYCDLVFLFTMGYEDSVYLAKLAEQAERYEGKTIATLGHSHR